MVLRVALIDAPDGTISSADMYQIAVWLSFGINASSAPGHGKRRIAVG